jgi:hypothetical protein
MPLSRRTRAQPRSRLEASTRWARSRNIITLAKRQPWNLIPPAAQRLALTVSRVAVQQRKSHRRERALIRNMGPLLKGASELTASLARLTSPARLLGRRAPSPAKIRGMGDPETSSIGRVCAWRRRVLGSGLSSMKAFIEQFRAR